MIGVTIGIGPGWDSAAVNAMRQMHRMTGLTCVTITQHDVERLGRTIAHPSWMKCFVLELFPTVNEFLVFDADILPLAKWDPPGLFESLGRNFCAVPEDNSAAVLAECRARQIPFPDWYVNGGLMMFSRDHSEVWDRVWQRHPSYGPWLEQSALNKALLELRWEVARLPRRFNRLLHGRPFDNESVLPGDVNVHVDSLGGNAAPLLELQSELFK